MSLDVCCYNFETDLLFIIIHFTDYKQRIRQNVSNLELCMDILML